MILEFIIKARVEWEERHRDYDINNVVFANDVTI